MYGHCIFQLNIFLLILNTLLKLEHEILIDQTNSTSTQTSFETEQKENANNIKRLDACPNLTETDSLEQDSPPMQEAPWQQEWKATSTKRKAALQKQQQRTQDNENERCDQNGVLHLETNRVELQNGKGILCCKR